MRAGRTALVIVATLLSIAGCDDSPPKKNPFDPPPDQAKKPPPIASVKPPSGPPDIVLTGDGAKVGWRTVLIDKKDGRQRLDAELKEVKEHIDGKEPTLRVDRKSKMPWVVLMFDALADAGATKIKVKTDTRKEFPKELLFTPLAKIDSPPQCSIVAMVLADRGTAVWKLAGGTAGKRAKGFAGPDLSMTGETIEQRGAKCKSSQFYVSAAEGIEWGLAYDLAASATKLDAKKVKFDTFVLLHETPVAGRKVDLSTD